MCLSMLMGLYFWLGFEICPTRKERGTNAKLTAVSKDINHISGSSLSDDISSPCLSGRSKCEFHIKCE